LVHFNAFVIKHTPITDASIGSENGSFLRSQRHIFALNPTAVGAIAGTNDFRVYRHYVTYRLLLENHSGINVPMTTSSSESLLTLSRRAFVLLLITFLWLGATCMAIAFVPESIVASWPMRAPWVFPVALVLAWLGVLRGHRGAPDRAETELVINDEFRKSNILRAQRVALAVVLLLQVPLALAAIHLPVTRALVAMAGGTITIGMGAVTSAFLYLDRE